MTNSQYFYNSFIYKKYRMSLLSLWSQPSVIKKENTVTSAVTSFLMVTIFDTACHLWGFPVPCGSIIRLQSVAYKLK